jgi:hypothetical protein
LSHCGSVGNESPIPRPDAASENGGSRKPERALLSVFRKLGGADQALLLEIAQRLAGEVSDDGSKTEMPSYVEIPRPAEESVIKAIRRLTATYPSMDKKDLLTKSSSLMSEHLLQNRPAMDVIDELEQLFRAQYEAEVARAGDNRA